MKTIVLVSCVIRGFAVITFANIAMSVLVLAHSEGAMWSNAINVVCGLIVDVLLVGFAWTYAMELGRFAIADGRSHVATALRASGTIVLLGWSGYMVNMVAYWMMQRALDEESREQMLQFIGGTGAVAASVVIVVLAVAFLVCASAAGSAVARLDLARKLRASIE